MARAYYFDGSEMAQSLWSPVFPKLVPTFAYTSRVEIPVRLINPDTNPLNASPKLSASKPNKRTSLNCQSKAKKTYTHAPSVGVRYR